MRRWPISEYLARTRWSRRMVRALKRHNPNGKLEGERPRGVTPAQHVEAVAKARRDGPPNPSYQGWR